MRFARVTGSYFRHGELISKAFRAASTALSTSAFEHKQYHYQSIVR